METLRRRRWKWHPLPDWHTLARKSTRGIWREEKQLVIFLALIQSPLNERRKKTDQTNSNSIEWWISIHFRNSQIVRSVMCEHCVNAHHRRDDPVISFAKTNFDTFLKARHEQKPQHISTWVFCLGETNSYDRCDAMLFIETPAHKDHFIIRRNWLEFSRIE